MVAAMRTPDRGMPLLRKETGAGEDDDRLIGVQLDLMDSASIAAAAKAIEEAVGALYAIVHNAGISAAGMVEETDMALWQNMFATHVMGPVALTKALLPAMRAAGQGRIVLVSSAGGVPWGPAMCTARCRRRRAPSSWVAMSAIFHCRPCRSASGRPPTTRSFM